jgi:putative hydrolase of the HAD superfamily
MDAAAKKWIAFDAAGTLFETADPVEKIYAECFATHGFPLPKATWKKAFRQSFNTTPDPIYPGDGDGEEAERNWWRDLVGCAVESAGISPDHEIMEKAFGELFDHYAAGSAWKLFPETETILTSLESKGIGLAVASNFDFRIHRILRELGISGHFDLVLTSADVGARKPSPLILRRLLSETDSTPSNCCLTGDSLHADKGAADAAGIRFFHIDRPNTDLNDFHLWHAETFFPK